MTQVRSRQSDEKFCSACGNVINVKALMCPNCGVPQSADAAVETPLVAPARFGSVAGQRVFIGADEKYCSSCGAVVKKLAEVCPTCGVRQNSVVPAVPSYDRGGKDKWLTVILAVLLGWAGGHKFYLKKYGQGFLYLALSWTTIPLWISLIEALVYLFTPSETFQKRYPL
ncbi:MAG: NINE protein [Chloroflexi bacterium]|nr:NINE protein [Chloroflexota bacterium]